MSMELIGPFPPEIKPVRNGVYRIVPDGYTGLNLYAYWFAGNGWGLETLSITSAYHCASVISPDQLKRWSGLTESSLIAATYQPKPT